MRPVYFIALTALFLVGCGAAAGGGEPGHPMSTPEPESILENITITAGDTVLDGVLFDNETARALAERLPLTVSLWDPAESFAKAFDLDDPLPDAAAHTRSYELGGLAYWDDGPSVAILYNDDLPETIVPVTTIGKIISSVEVFEDYGGAVTIEKAENAPVQTAESGTIPAELQSIPDGYRTPAKQQGKLEKLTYDTWESFTYAEHTQRLTKEAWVYLPYGYDDTKPYNVFYLSHGGWSDETTLMGTADDPGSFKNVIDHAIQDGKMQPMILVMPTYNNTSPQDSGNYSLAVQLTDRFHNELVNDLIPAVESKYSTYAQDTTPQGLRASRDHRGFGGFSMGSVNTWATFRYALDYFRYFMPMSGSYSLDGSYMASLAKAQGYGPQDFFIFAASGTNDFAYRAFKAQIMTMAEDSDGFFTLADSELGGNLSFREHEGYEHNATACDEYTYNGLCFFWNASQPTG